MAYTVKQVAAMSGVSVRTLHFYDETGLLKPAYHGANGYRFYEEPQLLTLQQILFYRELGFELKEIKRILGRADFEKVAALQSHRKVLQKNLARTRTLIETIDKTIEHLKGTKKMKSEEMFVGFSVAAGKDRFDEHIQLGGEPNDCKVSAQDTHGAMCVFEFSGTGCGPRQRPRASPIAERARSSSRSRRTEAGVRWVPPFLYRPRKLRRQVTNSPHNFNTSPETRRSPHSRPTRLNDQAAASRLA